MKGIQYALRRVHGGENEITKQLLQIAERHRVEHEVHHVARDLASWSREHVQLIAQHARDYELELDEDAAEPPGLVGQARESLSTAIGRRPEPGVLLLEDLRDLYLRASQNSLAWEMVAQIAQAKQERELLELSEQCHPQTLRQMRWANTMIKTQTPQILASL